MGAGGGWVMMETSIVSAVCVVLLAALPSSMVWGILRGRGTLGGGGGCVKDLKAPLLVKQENGKDLTGTDHGEKRHRLSWGHC